MAAPVVRKKVEDKNEDKGSDGENSSVKRKRLVMVRIINDAGVSYRPFFCRIIPSSMRLSRIRRIMIHPFKYLDKFIVMLLLEESW